MKFKTTVIEKDGITVAVALVNRDVFEVDGRARDVQPKLQAMFPDMPVVMMTRNKKDVPVFFGRPDLVNGMGDAVLEDAEWTEYTLQ